mmetsp:Transcript_20297/g.28603  ORF Transcript_20297/g.28603 Transcript_20297/m.28603 type:complete len:96 (+) Transcript_20297:321-608(+)
MVWAESILGSGGSPHLNDVESGLASLASMAIVLDGRGGRHEVAARTRPFPLRGVATGTKSAQCPSKPSWSPGPHCPSCVRGKLNVLRDISACEPS